MFAPSPRQRVSIAVRAYAVAGIFVLCFVLLRRFALGLSPTEVLILSALASAPLGVALHWERIKGFKVGQVEITLADIAVPTEAELAGAIQEQQGSATQALVQTIGSAIERKDLRLVEVNLRSSRYWWSTRLYLLAALADDYTDIERLVFVEEDASRVYAGMAAPRAVRGALRRRFPDYEERFHEVQQSVRAGGGSSRTEVEQIGSLWSGKFASSEEQMRVLVSTADLGQCLGGALETEGRQWDGSPPSRALYARILTCRSPFVALLQGRRLERVVKRDELARRIAESALA